LRGFGFDRRRRWNITILSPGDLVPLLCQNCGAALQGGDEAALFLCSTCGIVYEPAESGLLPFRPLTATVTSELAVGGDVRYLAVWRVMAEMTVSPESSWNRICKVSAPEPPYLYVPAFTLARAAVQRIGVNLTEAQPALELTTGVVGDVSRKPSLVGVANGEAPEKRGGKMTDGTTERLGEGPGFGLLSPVVVGRKDAHALAHFVYLAVESHETRDLLSVDYELEVSGEELVFVPAVWDPRYYHGSNWRLLLREFDGLVA
jgi:hypothetical protein